MNLLPTIRSLFILMISLSVVLWYISRPIQRGEGLIGTWVLEREPVYLNKIPENYLEISSGIGQAKPRSLFIVPLIPENELSGIIEIASFHNLENN